MLVFFDMPNENQRLSNILKNRFDRTLAPHQERLIFLPRLAPDYFWSFLLQWFGHFLKEVGYPV